jgi:hypothetical protein
MTAQAPVQMAPSFPGTGTGVRTVASPLRGGPGETNFVVRQNKHGYRQVPRRGNPAPSRPLGKIDGQILFDRPANQHLQRGSMSDMPRSSDVMLDHLTWGKYLG